MKPMALLFAPTKIDGKEIGRERVEDNHIFLS